MDLTGFAEEVGGAGPVTITGLGTRGGGVPGLRFVQAPAGIDWLLPDEMTICCGAGTPVRDIVEALGEVGQTIVVPPSGTIGGALAVGQSGVRRLGRGPIRDCLLQARYVSSEGRIVKAGGPTVKNVSGFDLCRLLVGSRGTLGFLGEVILRTQPRPEVSAWFTTTADPWVTHAQLYRPASILWDGTTTWVCLEGMAEDVDAQVARLGLVPADGIPRLPTGGRWSLPPARLKTDLPGTGEFVAEIGVGIVHHSQPAPARPIDPSVVLLQAELKRRFDPAARLNPGVIA